MDSRPTGSEFFARKLLDIGAVMLSPERPFTWASGLQAPLYCDNRLALSYPDIRSDIARGLTEIASGIAPDAGLVVGVATAGIPHATLVADRLDLPMAYVRGAAKAHGRGNRIEGRVESGDRAVVIEDLISTGGSSLAAVDALREEGVDVAGVIGVFSYRLDIAIRRFAEAAVALHTLATLDDLLSVAGSEGRLDASQIQSLREWRDDPGRWSDRHRR